MTIKLDSFALITGVSFTSGHVERPKWPEFKSFVRSAVIRGFTHLPADGIHGQTVYLLFNFGWAYHACMYLCSYNLE